MGADFDAAVAADAAIVIKEKTIIAALNGFGRAVFPALTAQAAGVGSGHRSPEKMAPQKRLQKIRAKTRGAGIRQLEGDVRRPFANDASGCVVDTQRVGRSQGRQLRRR